MRVRFILIFMVLAAGVSVAQSFRGAVVGTVVDSSGASVAEANVKAVSVETGLTREAVTAGDGNFTFTELPPGNYQISVSKQGFRTATTDPIRVAVGNVPRVNVTLTPGEVSERIEVNSEVPLVETTGNTLGGTLDAAQLSELPVNGRDFTKMLVNIPGSNADPSSVNDSPGSFGVFAVNGNRGRSNNFLLDGTDMNDGFRNDPAINEGGVFGIPATLLPVDAIQEMAILNNTEAEYGRNSGSIVNIVTKSGSNELHGTAFEYFRNDHLDARNFFNFREDPVSGQFLRKNIFQNNQFGGSLGGAVKPDKTFWFLAYEGQREQVGIPSPATIPTEEQITLATPAAGINPIIQNILNLNPWGPLPEFGNGGPGSDTARTLEVTTKATNRLDSLIGKIDHHLGKNDLLTGRYYFGDSDQSAPLAIVGGNLLPGYNTIVPTRVQIASLSLTHVISPRALLELRGGWNQFRETFSGEDQSLNPASLGLNTGNAFFTLGDYGLPVIAVSGYAGLGANKSDPRGRVDTNLQAFNNFTINSGKHSYKLGYEYRRTSVRQYFDLNHRGKLSFGSLGDFLAGLPDGGSQTFGNSRRNTYQNNHGFYFQDSYRYTHRLTFNVGVRWDYFGVIGEKDNLFSIFSPSSGLQDVGTNGGPATLYPKDKNNFSPRFGVAYDAFGTGKTVLRAGWGLAYDAFSQDFFAGQIPYNTSNAGPVFNGVGTRPILYGSIDPHALEVTPGPCASIQLPVAGTTGCTGPVFNSFAATDVFTVAQNLSTPYVQNYNLNIEQQLGSRVAVMVGFVGSSGRHLFRFRDINQVNPLTGVRPFDSGPFTPPAGGSPGGGQFGYVNQFESMASSTYNSVQAKVTARNLGGLTTSLNYTYGHSIDNASDGQDYAPNQAMPDNSFNPAGERSNSGFDVRHHLTWLLNYKFPESRVMPIFFSGWGVNGIVSVSSGMPFTVSDFDNFNGSGEFIERPDLVGNPFAGTSTPYAFLNLSAFQAPCSVPDLVNLSCSGVPHFGSSGRNKFYGPHFRNFDLGLTKDTKLGERVTMQLRIDAFNVFNHPNFANPVLPNFIVDWSTNGIDANGRGIGFLPLTLTPDVGAQNPYLGGGGPRNFELAVRFTF
jgi:Carboxypeptidase regulatory-like domain/TonB dependent receptor/TonB-dependent Receptor Plug Domain